MKYNRDNLAARLKAACTRRDEKPIEDNEDGIVPFGKYKRRHISHLLKDTGYVGWIQREPGMITGLMESYPEFGYDLAKAIGEGTPALSKVNKVRRAVPVAPVALKAHKAVSQLNTTKEDHVSWMLDLSMEQIREVFKRVRQEAIDNNSLSQEKWICRLKTTAQMMEVVDTPGITPEGAVAQFKAMLAALPS
jgi:hypothetical protein